MKHFKWLLIGLVVACLVTVPLVGCVGVSQSEFEALQAECEALQAENASLKGQLEEVRSRVGDLDTRLPWVELELHQAGLKIQSLESHHESLTDFVMDMWLELHPIPPIPPPPQSP